MSFLSGLSNIFHGIGHVFDAHDDDQKKKEQQQQQQQAQQPRAPMAAPGSSPRQNPTPAPVAPPKAAPIALPTALYQGNNNQQNVPQAGSYDPNAPLVKAVNDQEAARAAANIAHPQVRQSLIHNLVHGALTGAKDVGSVAAGTSLGVLRAGEGLVQGVTDIPKLAVDAGTWAGDKLSGTDYKPQFVKAIDNATNAVDAPQKFLQKKTDEAAQAFGAPGAAVYKPVQVAANVATVIPAGAAALSKIGEVRNLGKLGDVASGVNDFVSGQKAASPALQALEKVRSNVANRFEEVNGVHGTPDVEAPAKPSIEAGVKSANPNQERDAVAQAEAAAPPPPEPLPQIEEHALNDHEQAALTNLNKDAKTRVLTDDEEKLRTALRGKSDTIDAANNPEPTTPVKAGKSTGNPRSMRQFEYTDEPMTDGMKKALAELEGNQTNTDYQAAHDELRNLSKEAGQPELYRKVMQHIADNNMSQAEASAYIKQGLSGMRDSGTNAKIRGARANETTKSRPTSPKSSTTPPAQLEAPSKLITSTAPLTPVEKPLSKVRATPKTEAARPQAEKQPLSQVSTSPSKSPKLMSDTVPQTSNGVKTAPNAPNLRPQAVKDLEEIGKKEDAANPNKTKWQQITGSTKEHDVFSNDDLNNAADRYTATKTDEELAKDYASDGTKKVSINSAADLAKAYSAVKRFGKMAADGNKDVGTAIDDILTAAEEHVSRAGRTLNYAGSMYDSLPKEAKTAYLLRSVEKARASSGLEPLTDAEKSAATETINKLLDKGEGHMEVATKAQGKIEAARDAAKAGEKGKSTVGDLYKQDSIAQDSIRKAQAAQGELTDAYSKLAPEKLGVGNVGERAGNLARSLMLTSVTGRASDVASTSANVLHLLTQHSVEAAIGKIANTGRQVAGKTPGKYIDTLPSPTAFVHGGAQGLQKTTGELAGKSYVSDVQKMTKSNPEVGKGQLHLAQGSGFTKFVSSRAHAMAEAATNLSSGVKNTRLLQLAYQDGKKAGLTGDDLDLYAHSTALSPTKMMSAAGDKLIDEVNNMNDNPFTHGLETVAKGFDKIPVVGDTIRNLVSPFNRWIGGAAWNGVTDKNVVANFIKAGRAMTKGDSQEAVHQLAGLVTNSAGAMGAGYALAQAGVLRTTNGEGYNDDGLYLHLGAHNIPVGFFGFFAPGIIMGAATHDAMKDNSGKNIAQKVMDIATNSFDKMATAYLHNTTIGGGNSLLRDAENAIQHKSGVTWGDVGVNAAGDAAGNYIPGITGDANSAINTFNIGNLNPNHEAGLTKATEGMSGKMNPATGNPSTAKDVPKSVANQLANRIPVLGQKVVPRNPGVAAPDPYSRVFRGDNESPEQQTTKNAVSVLPQDQQDKVMAALRKDSGATKYTAQKAADAAAPGPAKDKAQQVVDKMNFGTDGKNRVTAAVDQAKQTQDVGKFQTTGSDQQIKTIGDKTYAMIKGKASSFDTPQKAQQAVDLQNFKDSSAKTLTKNGMVFERGSNGKVTSMEQKDYDYKQANDKITSAKNSGDVTGYTSGHQKLLDNIGWQLNHADLTPEARASLVQKAVQSQEEIAKTNQYGGFTKPKNATAYATPTITGAKDGYVPKIQEYGAKHGVDINALLSVAAVEGLGGGVGDGGHAFGPFQMNDAGGVLTGKYKSSDEAKAYAESDAGIEDAIKQIAAVAKGKTGADAIKAIVSGFERPADPNGEIAKALALYTGGKVKLTPNNSSSVTASDASSSAAAARNAANTIGSVHQMAAYNFGSLSPQKLAGGTIPTIQSMKSGDLIKQRQISVSKVK